MSIVSKTLIVSGVVLIVLGVIWHFSSGNIPFGKLPGDIRIEKGNSKIYIPITTCLLISGVLSLISYFISKK